MIEFNLLPDVKLQFVKTERVKHLVVLISILVAAVTLVIFIFFVVFVDIIQKKNISSLNGQIQDKTSQLQAVPNLNKILTIQNQLQSLPGLNNQKPVASRLFNYMGELTPPQLTISNLKVDFTLHTFSITGDADTIATINKFADTLKFTTYTSSNGGKTPPPAFSQVQLTGFSPNSKGATYTIQLSYDPAIFDAANTITLTVPKITSTRSATEQPTDLFKQSTTTTKP